MIENMIEKCLRIKISYVYSHHNKNKMKLQFKENVYGFIYDSQYGEITKVFNKPLTASEEETILEVLGEDDLLFTNTEEIVDTFEINDKDILDNDSEGFNEVLEFVD